MSADEAQKFREQIQATKEREEKEERARLAALEEAKKVAAAQESKNKSPKEDLKKEDPDPYGDAYENDAEPLEQAMKFVEPLQMHAAVQETHLLAFEVFIRQGKPILALKAVNEALKINSESYQAKANVARLAHVVETMDEANAMKKVMAMQVGKLTENKSPAAFLDTLDSRTSPVSAAAVALAKYGVTGDAARAASADRRRRRFSIFARRIRRGARNVRHREQGSGRCAESCVRRRIRALDRLRWCESNR